MSYRDELVLERRVRDLEAATRELADAVRTLAEHLRHRGTADSGPVGSVRRILKRAEQVTEGGDNAG